MSETITLTFGDRAENHKGMQIIGKSADSGFTKKQLIKIAKELRKRGHDVDIYDLSVDGSDKAFILICKNFLNRDEHDKLLTEMLNLNWDSKAFMYGRVVNKKARHNLCFDNESQEPDYENGKGRIISFSIVPELNDIKEYLESLTESELKVEGNYYYDTKKCGIGFHGDTERKQVIGIRLGETFPLYFQWYLNNKIVNDSLFEFDLSGGDLYIMSEKTTGNDWKRSSIMTLRHSAGKEFNKM